jgi:2-oxoglutarate ferredoxin oxidoreductase subunit alpha
LVPRLIEKIRKNADKIIKIEEDETDTAEVIVISYGITSRVAVRAVQQARKNGIKVGTLRLITVWPFPEKRIKELSKKVKAFVVPEVNYGQVVLEVERCVGGEASVIGVPHCGGWVHDPEDILKAIKEASK